MKAAVSQVKPEVKVTADTKPADTALTALQARMKALAATLSGMRADINDKAAEAKITKLQGQTTAWIRQLSSLTAKIDTTQYDVKIAAEMAKITAWRQQLSDLQVNADTSRVAAKIADLQKQEFNLQESLAGMKAGLNTTAMQYKLYAVQAELAVLVSNAKAVELAAKNDVLMAKIAASEAAVAKLKAEAADIQLGDPVKFHEAETGVLGMEDAVHKLFTTSLAAKFALDKLAVAGPAQSLASRLDLTAANAGLAKFTASMTDSNARLKILSGSLIQAGASSADMARRLRDGNAALSVMGGQAAKTATQVMDGRSAIAGLAASGQGATTAMRNMAAATAIMNGEAMRFAAQTLGMRNAVKSVVPAINDTESAWAKLQSWAFKGGGGFWGLGGAIGGVGLWHVALDGVIEAIIAVTGAVIAATAGIAAMSESAYDVGVRLHSVQVVSGALGMTIPPLTGHFDALMTAMAPRTIEAFGGGLALINSQTGGLLKVMEPVVNLFDTWIAKIDIWVAHQASFAGAVTHGTEYLAQFGQIIGQITEAIHNLLSKDPGIAHYLLDILVAASGLLDAFTKLPKPIVELTIGLHGLYIWAAVLSAVFLKMISPLANMVGWVIKLGTASKAAAAEVALLSEAQLAGTAAADAQAVGGLAGALGRAAGGARAFGAGLVALATNPLTWLVVAAAGLAYVAYQSHQADDATKKFISDMNTGLAQKSGGAAITGISTDIGALNKQISQATSASFLPAMSQQLSSFGFHGQATADALLGIDKNFGKAIGDVPQMLASWHNLANAGKDLGHAVSSIFHPSQAAAPIASANAIKAYDAEIKKLLGDQATLFAATGHLVSQGFSVQQSFALMELAGVKASDSLEVMNQKVANLIAGYKNVTGTGGMLESSINAVSFAALQQQEKVDQLNQGWDAFFKTISGGETGFVAFATQTNGLYKSLADGGVKLSDSNGKIRLSTTLAATAADKGKASMTGLNAASLQARNTFLQTAGAANTQMDNLTLLANAAGLGQKGVNMLAQANKDMVASMIPAAGHSKAMTDILYAMAQRGGYKGADSLKELSKWAVNTKDPIKNLDDITTQFTTDAANLADDVKNLSLALGTELNKAMADAVLHAGAGQAAFDDFAKAILNTHTKSSDLQAAANKLAGQLISVTGNAVDAKKEFETFAIGGLHKTKGEADALWDSFIRQKLTDAANKAGTTKKSFENLAIQLGGTKKGADNLWDSLHRLPAGKTITITEQGLGKFAISQTMTAANNPAFGITGRLATGGFIGTGSGPTADDVPAMLSRGEVVVPANMVSAGAVDHLRGALPGFAAGGLVPSYKGNIGGLGPWTTRNVAAFESTMTTAMQKSMTIAMKNAIAAAQAAAAGGGVGTGSDIVSYARSFLGKIPYVWGGTGPLGNDCSGFVQMVYNKFGYKPPRTSEAQGGWVTRTKLPETGGLAFFDSPAGGPPPGHVGIVTGLNSMISQAGPPGALGPTTGTLNRAMWTGVPPGGFHSAPTMGPGGFALGPAASGSALQAQNYAKSILWAYGWKMDQWPSLLALWNGESNWNAWAVNPNGGAYGIPQALGHGHPYNLGDYANQVRWGMAYISGKYGSPSVAYSDWLGRSPHWYSKGGLVGMATGGTVPPAGSQANLRFWLGAAQYGERRDYLGLAHAFAAGPSKYRTPLVRQELGTLARRQSAEEAGYKALAGAGLTKANLSHLGALARDESRTALDQALNKLPGGHPGWASGLRHYLGQLSTLSKRTIPPPGAQAGIPALWAKDPDLSALLHAVQAEMTVFWKLMGMKLPKTASVAQHKALAAWDKVLGAQQKNTFGLTSAGHGGGLFQQLMDSFINHKVPPWDTFSKSLNYMISEVEGIGVSGGINPPGTPHDSGHVPWHYFYPQWLAVLNSLRAVKSKLTPAEPWKPGSLGPSHTAPDGVLRLARGGQVWDAGGVLRPGWNPPMFNATGKDEHLVPAGGGGVHLHLTVNGPVGSQSELEDWFVRMANMTARTGKLSQAVRAAR